ncbi:heme NO-binding domain-containing protein [Thiolinea disciformis]|uniref:heme NO-binding domain-containing protein n=1 Tax=Thiolinea disciformis TaxID=125614 RepID=UPI00037B1C4D|nr:heme NO-binding domain-containing protein [Thiolinea disciformis]
MKGIFFTTFLEMVEQLYSANMVDDIIAKSNLPSEGAYTTVGSYHHSELVSLVHTLSTLTGESLNYILSQYGAHIFHELFKLNAHFFKKRETAFDLLESLNIYVEVEILKLYPNERMPSFQTKRLDTNRLLFTYRSPHAFLVVIEGFLQACFKYYNTSAQMVVHDHKPLNGAHADFEIILQ